MEVSGDQEAVIDLTVNGNEHEISIEPRKLLIQALREDLGYKGPQVGCDTSGCGACTVLMDGKAVKSCTVFALQAAGSEIETVEGLADDGQLDPVQESFREEHGSQCGYCTPGFLMTATELIERNPDPSREEIREGLEGNICRCTGYKNIVDAIQRAAEQKGGATSD